MNKKLSMKLSSTNKGLQGNISLNCALYLLKKELRTSNQSHFVKFTHYMYRILGKEKMEVKQTLLYLRVKGDNLFFLK